MFDLYVGDACWKFHSLPVVTTSQKVFISTIMPCNILVLRSFQFLTSNVSGELLWLECGVKFVLLLLDLPESRNIGNFILLEQLAVLFDHLLYKSFVKCIYRRHTEVEWHGFDFFHWDTGLWSFSIDFSKIGACFNQLVNFRSAILRNLLLHVVCHVVWSV